MNKNSRVQRLRVTRPDAREVTSNRSTALKAHKFQIGQAVRFTSSPLTRPGANGSYKIVKLLPSDGDDYQYRIKNPGEAFERVAKESQLDRAS
jgi:hypothetical protein